MALNLIPADTEIAFTRFAPIAQALSALAVLGSIAAFFLLGLNFGIDFRGGAEIEVGPGPERAFVTADLDAVRDAVGALDLGDVQVSFISAATPGGADSIVVRIEEQPVDPELVSTGTALPEDVQAENPTAPDADRTLDAEAGAELTGDACTMTDAQKRQAIRAGAGAELTQQLTACRVQDALRATLGADIVERRVDVVGPTVSGELVQKGVSALVIAVGLMLAYIWLRFEWQFSLGAITALVHDVILTIGVFAVTQLDFTLSIIAALLTIIGYSMNDTVVVFDRVRENLRRFKRRALPEVIDLSINQTLARTIMTSVTTLLALGSLYFLGGEVLRGFSFAMIWGVVVGTYSSVFIASPMLLRTGVKRDWEKQADPALATP